MLVELGWGSDCWPLEKKKTETNVNEYVLKLTTPYEYIIYSLLISGQTGFLFFFLLREAGLADLEYSQFIKV